MENSAIKSAFLSQSKACTQLGSPFTAKLCRLVAENLPQTGLLWETVLNWEGDPGPSGDSVPLRVMGALHGLVVEGISDTLRQVYPPHHSNVSDAELWAIISKSVTDHTGYILDRMRSAPQTNEVQRAAVLVPGFMEIASQTGKREFVTSELGASAGLNLYWDKYQYQLGDVQWGASTSGTRLEPDWRGGQPDFSEISVRSRAGCDLNPIDISKIEFRQKLLSYVWPDQEARLQRSRSAIEFANGQKDLIEQSDAIDWLERQLQVAHKGAVHVIYHTIAWQYFPENSKRRGEELLEIAGRKATKEAPLAWLRLEADGKGDGAGLTLTLWPAGETKTIARGDFHGRWIDWIGW
ncbi:MAG: DUF2332 family protein [Sneathiella sp.]